MTQPLKCDCCNETVTKQYILTIKTQESPIVTEFIFCSIACLVNSLYVVNP
jgi:hypothetical protein